MLRSSPRRLWRWRRRACRQRRGGDRLEHLQHRRDGRPDSSARRAAVRVTRAALALEGTVAVLVMLIAAGVLLEALAPAIGHRHVLLLAVIVAVYADVVAGRATDSRVPLPGKAKRPSPRSWPRAARRVIRRRPLRRSPRQLLLMGADVAVIVLGSLGMVEARGSRSAVTGRSGTLGRRAHPWCR